MRINPKNGFLVSIALAGLLALGTAACGGSGGGGGGGGGMGTATLSGGVTGTMTVTAGGDNVAANASTEKGSYTLNGTGTSNGSAISFQINIALTTTIGAGTVTGTSSSLILSSGVVNFNGHTWENELGSGSSVGSFTLTITDTGTGFSSAGGTLFPSMHGSGSFVFHDPNTAGSTDVTVALTF